MKLHVNPEKYQGGDFLDLDFEGYLRAIIIIIIINFIALLQSNVFALQKIYRSKTPIILPLKYNQL